MAVKEEYDVLRLIEHNQVCYISSEYVKGSPLPRWIKYHPCMEKEGLFRMISDIAKQLSQIHRCRGNPCYQYVNPYSIIISEEGRIGFLDINAEANSGQLRIMQRRTVREHFLPPEAPYYQKTSVELDIYGLGRTIQYLLSEVEAAPPLSRGEEAKFQKIISRCLNRHSKKLFQNVSEIQRMIPKYKHLKETKSEKKYGQRIVTMMVAAGLLGVTIGGGSIIIKNMNSVEGRPDQKRELHEEQEQAADKRKESENNHLESLLDGTKEERLNMELGTVYFLELKNYEKSKEYFESVRGNALAEHMAVIAECFAGNEVQGEEFRQVLSDAETEVQTQNEEQIGEKHSYYHCILKGYTILEDSDGFRNILRLGRICLQDGSKKDTAEILGDMAYAHEGLGEIKDAIDMYEEQLKFEEDEQAREEIYKKTANLLIQAGESGRAQEKLRAGISEAEHSVELRTSYIAALLKDSNVERQLCIQNIQEQLQQLPELKEQEEFGKLMRQYGINVEGDKVW